MNNPILDKISKLLALANSKGATEAEASLAAEHVQRMLQDHGLTMAQVESHGGNAGDAGGARSKTATDHRAMYEYQRNLMAELAANHFCLHVVEKVTNAKPLYSGGRGKTSRVHVLVGRQINVQGTSMMYEYLDGIMRRLASEAGIDFRATREFNYFLEGATSRLIERLREKRRQAELESAAAERARQADQQGNGTGRELVLTDVYGSEADLNNDALNGFPPGTTAAATRKRRHEEQERARIEAALISQGVDKIEAFYRSYGYGPLEAKTYAEDWRKRSHRASRNGRGRSQGWTNADRREHEKVNSPTYKAGRSAGDSIGLDTQVGRSKRNLLK